MDVTRPLVSIVITNYNYEQFLPFAIESVLTQTYAPIEIVLVDDGSTDASLERAKVYADRVRVVAQPNGGQASAFLAGFAATTGDIICLLDADDLFNPEKVARVVQEFTEHPEIGWVFDRLTVFDDRPERNAIVDTLNAIESTWGYWDRRLEIKKARLPYVPTATSGLSFRRSLLSRILPMPEIIRITSDNYMKICSMAFEPGMMLYESLTRQRLHGSNAYTHERSEKAYLKSQIALITGIALYRKAPALQNLGMRMVSKHISEVALAANPDPILRTEIRAFLREIPATTLAQVLARASYHGLSSRLGAKR